MGSIPKLNLVFEQLTDYLNSLDPIARKKCVERLHLRVFDEYGDPYVTLTQTITVRSSRMIRPAGSSTICA